MFYNIKTEDVRANGRGRGRVGTPYYIIRARKGMGIMGMMGLMGGWERDSAMGIAGREFYRTGERRLQGRGKGVTWQGKKEKRERRNYQEEREEKAMRKKEKKKRGRKINKGEETE